MVDSVVKIHNNDVRAGTFLISKGFEREHSKVVSLIKKYEDRFLRLENNKCFSKALIISKVPAKKAGRPVEEYLLNEQQTVFLGTLFRNSEVVLDFKERLSLDFVMTKKKLFALSNHKKDPAYQVTRDIGKLIRRQTTDSMQDFIEYAKNQGSKNSDYYYGNISRMVNGLLFIAEVKFKNFRDALSIKQLMTISSAEQIVEKGLNDGMKNKKFYKEIYQDVKKRVIQFAELHGKSEVIKQSLIEE